MSSLTRTARTTGLLYLGLAITGLLGFLVIRNQIFVADDAAATLANLVEQESLARVGIVLELGVVVTQALVAVWFYRLFRGVDAFAAGCIAAFGMANALCIVVSAAFLATALDVALDPALAAGGSVDAQLMYVASGHLWTVGGLFFGLWLIPMGVCVLRSGTMPRALGWLLIGGGAGYVLSAVTAYVVPDADAIAAVLVIPASVGEFWMIGHLLLRGLGRRDDAAPVRPALAATGG